MKNLSTGRDLWDCREVLGGGAIRNLQLLSLPVRGPWRLVEAVTAGVVFREGGLWRSLFSKVM